MAMAFWYPPALIDAGNDADHYTDLGEPKGLLHTTEGKTYAGARAAYEKNNTWPHFTCTYENGVFKVFQHVSIFLAARALKNLKGGTETNRDNVVQIELVGSCNLSNISWGPQYVESFPLGYLDGIRDLMRWVEQQRGIPRRCNFAFLPYPASYGDNGVRLTNSDWDNYSGWLGHQHAPENTHGDPGLINIEYLLDEHYEQDWLEMATREDVKAAVKEALAETINGGNWPQRCLIFETGTSGVVWACNFLTGERVNLTADQFAIDQAEARGFLKQSDGNYYSAGPETLQYLTIVPKIPE
jgi:hypothetical protein